MELKVGFDIHGVLDLGSDIMSPILLNLRSSNVKICVVSGAPIITLYRELNEKYHYDMKLFDEFYSVVDFLTISGCEMYRDWKDTWWSNDVDWYNSKLEICKKYNIRILIDNDSRYFKPNNSNIEYVLLSNKNEISSILDITSRIINGEKHHDH